jgi:cytoskeletal protein CcmA (bactofilin family)
MAMVVIGSAIVVRGEIQTTDDATIEGFVEGTIWCDGLAVVVAADATIVGDIVARDITVFGSVIGTMVASEVVDMRATAHVKGRVVAAGIILADGGSFNGTVHPQQVKAALSVARHRRERRDEISGVDTGPVTKATTSLRVGPHPHALVRSAQTPHESIS